MALSLYIVAESRQDALGRGSRVLLRLEKENVAKCYALSARNLSLPWEDDKFN